MAGLKIKEASGGQKTTLVAGDAVAITGSQYFEMTAELAARLSNAESVKMHFAASDEDTPLTVQDEQLIIRADLDFTLTRVYAYLNVPQTAGDLFEARVVVDGEGVQPLLQFPNATQTDEVTGLSIPVTQGQLITINIEQIGDGLAAGLKIQLHGTYT